MERFKDLLRRNMPPKLLYNLRYGREMIWRFKDLPGIIWHPWMQDSRTRLKKYQDRYRGERCFVIGNGPSLRQTDISLLKDEFSFGMNRVYLAFKDWGFQTSCLVSVNDLVVEQCWQDFQGLDLPKFFAWRSRGKLFPQGAPDQQTHFLDTTYTRPTFGKELGSRFWEGATVTYVCLQLAYCLGFSEVYLVGVDHNFQTQGPANQTVVSSGDDPNHFSPEYFGKGFRWQLPDLQTSEQAYLLADSVFKADGRKIIDATVGGKLQVFPKVDLNSLF